MKFAKTISLTIVVIMLIVACAPCTYAEVPTLTQKESTDVNVWDGSVAGGFSLGTGAETDPYIIDSAEVMAYFAQQVNSGTSYHDSYIKLTADIILNDTADIELWQTTPPANKWTPIGIAENGFSGCFDGDGHTISGMYINGSDDMYCGLFSHVTDGSISNLIMRVSFSSCQSYAAVFAASCENAAIVDISVQDSYVTASEYAAGICAYAGDSTLTGCFSSAYVFADNYTGGIVSKGDALTISACCNAGNVTAVTACAGGIIASAQDAVISDCYNTGYINSTVSGGIAGAIEPETVSGATQVSCCYNAGIISSNSMIGSGECAVSSCYYIDNQSESMPVCTVLTEEQAGIQDSFEGFDFENVWTMSGNSKYPYPELKEHVYPACFRIMLFDGIAEEIIGFIYVLPEHSIAAFPIPPVHAGYRFTEWSYNGEKITSDIRVTAKYVAAVYTVAYYIDDVLYRSQTYSFGQTISPITVPQKEGYTFGGWQNLPEIMPADDIRVDGYYTQNAYAVTFKDGITGEVLSTKTVLHGNAVEFPQPAEHDGYVFMNWDCDGENIIADVTITSVYALIGDANEDGYVDTGDAVLVLRSAIGSTTLTERQQTHCDMNGDGRIDTGDAVAILCYCIGKNSQA